MNNTQIFHTPVQTFFGVGCNNRRTTEKNKKKNKTIRNTAKQKTQTIIQSTSLFTSILRFTHQLYIISTSKYIIYINKIHTDTKTEPNPTIFSIKHATSAASPPFLVVASNSNVDCISLFDILLFSFSLLFLLHS